MEKKEKLQYVKTFFCFWWCSKDFKSETKEEKKKYYVTIIVGFLADEKKRKRKKQNCAVVRVLFGQTMNAFWHSCRANFFLLNSFNFGCESIQSTTIWFNAPIKSPSVKIKKTDQHWNLLVVFISVFVDGERKIKTFSKTQSNYDSVFLLRSRYISHFDYF